MINEFEVLYKIDEHMKKLWDKDNGVGSDTLPAYAAGMAKAKMIIKEEIENSEDIKYCGEAPHEKTFPCPIYSNIEWGNNRNLCGHCKILNRMKS